MLKQLLLRRFPFLYRVRITQLQFQRRLIDLGSRTRLASELRPNAQGSLCQKHKSILRRALAGTDPQLQENKIVNLGIAIKHINGVVIRPGETFSFWSLIGKPTARKGYIEGLMLSNGEVKRGVGGGLCQLANLLFWLALHTPLAIAERHHHSFDLFPDDRRVVPFGSGTSIFYNYVDLRFHNPTEYTFTIQVWLTDTFLEGRILSDRELEHSYKVEERNHRFYEEKGKRWRENEIWRLKTDHAGHVLSEARVIQNKAEVKYGHVETNPS